KNQEKDEQEHVQKDVVEHGVILEIENPEQIPLRNALNSVFPMGERCLQIDEIQYLRQRERDHRKIDTLAADRDDAGDDAKACGAGGADQNSKLGRKAPDLQRMRGDVACSAQKHRVTERQQTAIADQQVEGASQ